MSEDKCPDVTETAHEPLDVPSMAVAALAHLDISPGRRLREVAGLAIAMNTHADEARAAEIDEAEIREGCRTMGELHADVVAMGLSRNRG